ncbi:MAG TPA: hypothetical protein ENI13_01140, partial [candidate division CPR3 bacterium]|nr:hypothetical protein [candidate division CPR3 bacterium]
MSLFVDLLEKGISPEVALPIAMSAGIGIGVTEVFQLKIFGAGFKKVFAKAIATKTAQNALIQAATFWAKSTGLELSQEVIQEGIQMMAKWLAGSIEDNPNVLPTKEEFVANMAALLKASPAIAVISAPAGLGRGINVKAAQRQAIKDVNEKLIRKQQEAEEARQEEELKFRLETGRTSLVTEREVEGVKPDIDKKIKEVERTETDRRTAERRKFDLLEFKGRDAIIDAIINIDDPELLPDNTIDFIIRNEEEFSPALVEFAEKKGIPKDKSPIEVGKIVNKRREERRQEERRREEFAKTVQVRKAITGEGIKELSQFQKDALRDIQKEKHRGAELEFEGDTDKIKAITKTIKRKDIPARITHLKDEVKGIDKDLDNILKKVAKEDKPSNVAILHRDTLKLLDKRALLAEEITALQILGAKTDFDLGTKKVTLRANEVIALQEKALKERIAGIEKGMRLQKKITEKDIKALQKEFASFIVKSEVDPEVKVSLLRDIANIQTEKQLIKALPKIKERVDKALDKTLKRLLIDNIKDLTKPSKLAKVSSEFKPQIEAILAPFSITKPTKATVAKTVWAAKTLRENAGNQITPEELSVLER